jgi:hypothetical protein
VAKTNLETVNREPCAANVSIPVLRDSRIAVPNDVSCALSTKNHHTKGNHKNMDLNAYVLAMAIGRVARLEENSQTVPEPEFKPFDLRYLKCLPVNSYQPRHIGRQRKAQNNASEALPA